MPLDAVAGIIGASGGNEITRHQTPALMQELEKCMLPIIAQFTPDDRRCGAVHGFSAKTDGLAVAFHLELLQEGREVLERLVIRQYSMGRCTQEVGVPDADERHDDRQIALEWHRAEMLVHALSAVQHFVKGMRSDRNHQRQTDRRPQRVASAHPIPDRENQPPGNPELDRFLRPAGNCGKMIFNNQIFAQIRTQPLTRRIGV